MIEKTLMSMNTMLNVIAKSSLAFLLTITFAFTVKAQTPLLKAENIKVILVKEIHHIHDTTKHHAQHEPHKSSYKIIHVTLNIVKSPEVASVAKGKKSVMMVLTAPDGSIIHDAEAGGGIFMVNGKESPYTLRHQIEFDGTPYILDFVYKNPHKYHKGTHVITFYSDGFKIGEEHFVVD